MKLLTAFLSIVPLLGQEKAATPIPETEPTLSGSIDLGYRWRTGVAGSFDTYRSVVNLGSGPKLLGSEFTLLDPKQRLFDRVDVRASDWGGDPYSTLHVTAQKARKYYFNADHRNYAYFNRLPSFAEPLQRRGVFLNQQAFDTRRKLTGFQLDLLPGNWFIPYLSFDRTTQDGTGVNAFVAGGNEYPVPTSIRNSFHTYRGGARFEFRRFHATLEQGGAIYKDDQQVYTSGSTAFGNNPTPLSGQTLSLTSLSQAYGIRGASLFSKGLFTGNVASWLDISGQILYSRPDTDIHYQDYATGKLANLSQLLFFTSQQYLFTAAANLPHTSASVGAEVRLLRNVRLLQSFLTDRQSGASSGTGSTPLTAALGNSLEANYQSEQVDLLWDPIRKLTLRGGYRYVWGDTSNVILPLAGLAGFEQSKLRQNIVAAGVTYRISPKLSVNGEIDSARSGNNYFRTSLYNYQKLRFRVRYRISSSLHLAADDLILNSQNPNPGIHYDYFAHQASLSATWTPEQRSAVQKKLRGYLTDVSSLIASR